jgi:hypothetical protein
MLKMKAESAKKLEILVGKLSPNAVDGFNALQSEEAQSHPSQSSVIHIEENIDMALAIEQSTRASEEARRASQSAENDKKNFLDDARHDMAKAYKSNILVTISARDTTILCIIFLDLLRLFSHVLIGTSLCVLPTHIDSRFCNPQVVIFY